MNSRLPGSQHQPGSAPHEVGHPPDVDLGVLPRLEVVDRDRLFGCHPLRLCSRLKQMDSEPIDPAHLGPVVRAAMHVLNRLDEEEVPARLRKVAGRSGKLPRPLAVSLLAELDRNDWLRDKVLASTPDLEVESSRPGDAVSALFLLRPDGWSERISKLLVSAPTPSSPAPDLPAELRRALVRIETLSGKVARLQSEQAQAHIELAKARKATVAPAPDQSSAPLRKRISELESELADLQTKYEASQAWVKELLRRRERVEPSRGQRWSGTPGKAVDLARQLDSQIATLRIPASPLPPDPVVAEPRAPLALPAGVAPDRAAFDRLAARGAGETLVGDRRLELGLPLADSARPQRAQSGRVRTEQNRSSSTQADGRNRTSACSFRFVARQPICGIPFSRCGTVIPIVC